MILEQTETQGQQPVIQKELDHYKTRLKSESKLLINIDINNILNRWKGLHVDWSILRGLTILDIGAGSGYLNPPHFSRFCAAHDADVTALDIEPQEGLDQKLFRSAQVDLVDIVLGKGLSSIPLLLHKRFDLIHASNFIGLNPDPNLIKNLADRQVPFERFESMVFQQTGELLKEGGALSLDFDNEGLKLLHTKQNGKIIPL